MDVRDLLSYQPDREDEAVWKKQRVTPATKSQTSAGESEPEAEAVPLDQTLDENGANRLLVRLGRAVSRNRELRVKFPDAPDKFMESESELFLAIKSLDALSTETRLFRWLVTERSDSLSLLLGTLAHENADVACATAAVLRDWTDMDETDEEEREQVIGLMRELVQQQLVPLLVTLCRNEDEDRDSDSVSHSLAIAENLLDADPDLVPFEQAESLVQWLVQRIGNKSHLSDNKLAAAEVLCILLPSHTQALVRADGMDVLLQQVAHYAKHQAQDRVEQELLHNLLHALCSSLFRCPAGRSAFLTGEGMELMLLILRKDQCQRSGLRAGALKVLSHALSPDGVVDEPLLAACCARFVRVTGLRLLFPVFLTPASVSRTVSLVEEQTLTILLSLLTHCTPDQSRRVVAKFVERDFEKTDRLLELHLKYHARVLRFDQRLGHDDDDDDDQEEQYCRRLADGGLFVLQLVDQVLVLVVLLFDQFFSDHTEQESVRERLRKLLSMRPGPVDHWDRITHVLTEQADHVDDQKERTRLLDLVARFGPSVTVSKSSG